MSKWISVKDKLPKDDQRVMMIEEGQDGLPTVGYYQCEDYIPGFYPIFSTCDIRAYITHWIPIPDPPSSED